jgi:hypothetical protein
VIGLETTLGSAWMSIVRVAPGLAMAAMLGACGANMNELAKSSTVANYQPASIFSPTGYSISNGADGSLHVTAAGPPGTPADRLEKIALARAAEYGNERHMKTFKATPAVVSITCGKTKVSIKGQQSDLKPMDYRVVAIDVTYANDAPDAQARSSRETADALKAELASEIVPADVQSAASQEVAQQCRR